MIKIIFLTFFCSSYLLSSGLSSNPKYITISDNYHIVQKGDTLEAIAEKYDVSTKKLKFYNNLSDSGLIIGQKIYLLPPKNQKNEYVTVRDIPACEYHIVRKGETLTRLAKMYDIYLFDLMEYNQLTDLSVEPKQKIWLVTGHFSEKITSNQKEIPVEKAAEITNTEVPIVPKNTIAKQDALEKTSSSKKTKFFMPTQGIVTSEFGMRGGRPHKGIDFAAAAGTPIYAAQKGKVIFSGIQRGYGNVIMIEHDNNYITVYAHNEANLVRENDAVKQSQPIATVGNSGNSSGAHLHFEIRVNGRAQNPRNYLPDF